MVWVFLLIAKKGRFYYCFELYCCIWISTVQLWTTSHHSYSAIFFCNSKFNNTLLKQWTFQVLTMHQITSTEKKYVYQVLKLYIRLICSFLIHGHKVGFSYLCQIVSSVAESSTTTKRTITSLWLHNCYHINIPASCSSCSHPSTGICITSDG